MNNINDGNEKTPPIFSRAPRQQYTPSYLFPQNYSCSVLACCNNTLQYHIYKNYFLQNCSKKIAQKTSFRGGTWPCCSHHRNQIRCPQTHGKSHLIVDLRFGTITVKKLNLISFS